MSKQELANAKACIGAEAMVARDNALNAFRKGDEETGKWWLAHLYGMKQVCCYVEDLWELADYIQSYVDEVDEVEGH